VSIDNEPIDSNEQVTVTPVEVEDEDVIEDVSVIEAEAEVRPSDIVTDSQIGKSIIYYIDELKKRIFTIAQEMEEAREKHNKLIKDLRDTLKNTEKELHDERQKANNLRIALNRMRNVPETNGKTSTFKMNEIAEIKDQRKKVLSL
jgi:vacuolar-type H+-ATPase subunit I/STV1